MKRKSSFVWNHFTMTGQGTKAICHHCNKELSYTLTTMSNLGRHIKLRHPEALAMDGNVDETEVYTVEEVGQEQPPGELKTYEITVKGFEEMEDMGHGTENQDETHDPEWTPAAEGSWRDQSSTTAGATLNKKNRKRSLVWNHFQRSPCKTSATCLHCSRVIRMGTISNLARHLRHKHPNKSVFESNEYTPSHKPSYVKNISVKNEIKDEENFLTNDLDICSEVIELTVDSFQNPANVILSKTTVNEEKSLDNGEIDIGIMPQSSHVGSLNITEDFDMHDYIKPKETFDVFKRIDRQLVKMIVKGCHPVTMVEERGFKDLIALLNPKYQLPSLHKLTNELIPKYYQECESRATKSLREAEGICLYVDRWKSKAVTYMCVTAHLISQECKFESLFLACHIVSEDEKSTEISQRLLETVTEWEISGKVVAVVTDNTEMMIEAVKTHNWTHIPHFVRTLCFITHESLQGIKTITTKVKNITEELKKSPEVIAEIYSKHKNLGLSPLKLITDIKNGWTTSFTTLEMLSRFSRLRAALTYAMHHTSDYKLNENEWRVLKSVVDDVLCVFKEVKQEVIKEERVCMSKVVYFIKSIGRIMNQIQNTNNCPSDAIYVATTAGALLDKQFGDFMASDLASVMMLLDPRLKKHAFSDESDFALACSKLKKEVCEVTAPEPECIEPDPTSFWYYFDQEVMKRNNVKDPIGKGILELENYLQEQVLERDKDPLVWWDQRKAIYPRLFKLMKKYLCVTTKYAQRESISYKTAYMLSQLKTGSLSSESELMFLHHNM